MIIDFHTHIFPDAIAPTTIPYLSEKNKGPAYTSGMASGLMDSMDQGEVATSIVLPVVTKPSQFQSINKFAAEVNETYGQGRLISLGGIHPDCEDYKGCLRQIKELGLKGIKLHPDYQDTFINDVKYMRIIEYASELDLIVITHAGYDVGIPDPIHCPPKLAREVIDKIQPEKFVLAHMGGMTFKGNVAGWDEVEEYLVGQNVYFDTAYVLPIIERGQFKRIVQNHGVEKILFATDSPWQDQGKCVEIMKGMDFTKEELGRMFEGNVRKLLEL